MRPEQTGVSWPKNSPYGNGNCSPLRGQKTPNPYHSIARVHRESRCKRAWGVAIAAWTLLPFVLGLSMERTAFARTIIAVSAIRRRTWWSVHSSEFKKRWKVTDEWIIFMLLCSSSRWAHFPQHEFTNNLFPALVDRNNLDCKIHGGETCIEWHHLRRYDDIQPFYIVSTRRHRTSDAYCFPRKT